MYIVNVIYTQHKFGPAQNCNEAQSTGILQLIDKKINTSTYPRI